MPAKKSRSKPKAAAKPAKVAPRPAARRAEPDLGEVVAQLAVLTAANHLMAQTAFLSLERMRVSSEVVDERVTAEFGNDVFAACERLVEHGDALVLDVLDKLGMEGERADAVRALVGMRRQFKDRTRKPKEQPRLVESLERMYR
jgi:hypothetical protein